MGASIKYVRPQDFKDFSPPCPAPPPLSAFPVLLVRKIGRFLDPIPLGVNVLNGTPLIITPSLLSGLIFNILFLLQIYRVLSLSRGQFSFKRSFINLYFAVKRLRFRCIVISLIVPEWGWFHQCKGVGSADANTWP